MHTFWFWDHEFRTSYECREKLIVFFDGLDLVFNNVVIFFITRLCRNQGGQCFLYGCLFVWLRYIFFEIGLFIVMKKCHTVFIFVNRVLLYSQSLKNKIKDGIFLHLYIFELYNV